VFATASQKRAPQPARIGHTLTVTLAQTLWRSVSAVDRSKLRRWSALRRGLVVVLTLAVGSVVVDPQTGALASVASLYVALQDRNASTSYTSRVMFVQSLLYSGVVLVGGLLDRFWPVSVVLLTVAAGLSGLAAHHDKAVSRMFGDVLPVAAFLGVTLVRPDEAPMMALAVLLGGLAQALLARLSALVEADVMERRPVAAALVAVADHIDDALPRRRATTGRAAEDRLSAAVTAVSVSDLGRQRRRRLLLLVKDAEKLRQEAGAVRVRRAIGLRTADGVPAALANASTALRSAATALRSTSVAGRMSAKSEQALASLYPCRLEAERVLANETADSTSRYLAHRTLRLYGHVAALVATSANRTSTTRRRVGDGASDYLTHPQRRDLVIAARLALATLLSLGIAVLLDLPHGAWVASTTVALLRPDYRALTADTVARALGTALAVALALPLVLVTGNNPGTDLLLVFALATATFAIASVNEGLYVMTVSMVTVFTLAVVGEDPTTVAVDRIVDVLLGCSLAIAFLVLIPVTHGRRLARDLADYADATATWMDAVAERTEGATPRGGKALRRSVREARVAVEHGVELRVVEPQGPGMSAALAEKIFDGLHTTARVGVAVDRSLKHGETTEPTSGELARSTARTLRQVAETVRDPAAAQPQTPLTMSVDEADDIAVLLAHGYRSSQAALLLARTGA